MFHYVTVGSAPDAADAAPEPLPFDTTPRPLPAIQHHAAAPPHNPHTWAFPAAVPVHPTFNIPPTYPDPQRFDQPPPPPRPPATAPISFDGLFPHHPHKSPRKRQKRSAVWNFFKESESDPNKALCQICHVPIPRGKNLARNTTNLRKHLEHRHPEFASHVTKKRPASTPASFSSSRKRPTLPPPAKSHIKLLSQTPQHSPPALPPHLPPTSTSHLDDSATVLPLHSPPNSAVSAIPSPSMPLSHPSPSMYTSNPPQQLHSDPGAADLHHPDQSHAQTLSSQPPLHHASSHQPHLQTASLLHAQQQPSSHPPPLPPHQPHHSKLIPHQPHSSHSAVLPTLSWTPSKVASPLPPPPPASETLPNLIESSTNTNLTSNTTSQDANFALLRFLALNNLPLSISSSSDFRQLFHLVQDRPNFPNVDTLRNNVLNSQVQQAQAKISTALESADSIVLKVENGHLGLRFIVCEYILPPLQKSTVLLDIVTEEDLSIPNLSNAYCLPTGSCSAVDSYNSCAIRRLSQTPAQQKATFNRLLDRVSLTIDYWRIRSKLMAVVMSETVFSGDERLYLPQMVSPAPGNTLEIQGSYKINRGHANGTTDLSFEDNHCDPTISLHRDRIPIISCVIRTLTNIFEQVMSHDDMVERRFVGPMSRAMYKVLTDNEFRLTEAASAWPTHLRLPMHKPSLWELSSFLWYFAEHIETVQSVIKRAGENSPYEFLFVLKEEVVYLYSMVNIFITAVKSLSLSYSSSSTAHGIQNGSYTSSGEHMAPKWFAETLSAGIPALRNVMKNLEELPPAMSDEVRTLRKLAVESTKRHLACMEEHDLFLCSTLLDPRYKQGYFSSKEVVESAERVVLDAFEEERRKGEGQKNSKNVDALLNGCVGASSSLEQYMTSIIPEANSGSCSLTQYLNEQAVERWHGEEFWKRNLHRWPLLSRAAGRFCLLAGVCESEEVRLEIEREQNMRVEGDTRKKEQMTEKIGMAFLRKNYMSRE